MNNNQSLEYEQKEEAEVELPTETQNENLRTFKLDSLESIRKRLLDLTARNSLLNYRHPKVGCVRIIDEVPDQIFEELRDGEKLTFIPVPEATEAELVEAGYIKTDTKTNQKIVNYPTAEQWAKNIGLQVSYDLPDVADPDESKHQDKNLQSLLYAPELEARLRKIRANAESAIEESGANILYLALGFLEWYESRESDQPRLAPLFTIPVHLERGDLDRRLGAYRYKISIKDEGLVSNITLREKLSNDFGLILPLIDDETTPETYFNVVANTILEHQPRWRIRRQATLVQLNFAKQAMYQDLDPGNWPPNAGIQDHPIIKIFFASQAGESSTAEASFAYQSEHKLDEIQKIHEQYPLIDNADSSQHSAVIDVVNGENLVIEGPPGSGKSQTITNFIAACIANGQKVLFVAEKMAALNVVKSRLDKAHLGDFCLELHSHKTNKLKILSDLVQRLSKQDQFSSPQKIEADIERYESLKQQLNSYVKKVNSEWGNTGKTIHEILQKATRLREELKINPDQLFISGIDGLSATGARQNELLDNAKMLESIFRQVSKQSPTGLIQHHFWHGLEAHDLDSTGIESCCLSLENWSSKLELVLSNFQNYMSKHNQEETPDPSLSDIECLIERIENLPALLGGELLEEKNYIAEEKIGIETWLVETEKLYSQVQQFLLLIQPSKILDGSTTSSVFETSAQLKSFGISPDTTISEIAEDQQRVSRLLNIIDELEKDLALIREHSPAGLSFLFQNNYIAYKEFLPFIKCITDLPRGLWKFRDPLFDDEEIDDLIPPTEDALSTLHELLEGIDDVADVSRLPSLENLRNIKAVLDSGGIFKWLSKEYRDARKSLFSLSKTTKPNKALLLGKLPLLVNFASTKEHLDRLHASRPALGSHYKGVETDLGSIKQLREWYKTIRGMYGRGFGGRVKIGDQIRSLDAEFGAALIDLADRGLYAKIEEVHSSLDHLIRRYPNHDLSLHRNRILNGADGNLSLLHSDLVTTCSSLSAILKDGNSTINELVSLSDQHNQFMKNVNKWRESTYRERLKPFGKAISIEPGELSQLSLDVLKNSVRIAINVCENELLSSMLERSSDELTYKQLIQDNKALRAAFNDAKESEQNFVTSGSVNIILWSEGMENASLLALLHRNKQALDNRPWLETWRSYLGVKHRLIQQGLENLITGVETNRVAIDNLPKVVELAISHQLAKEVLKKQPDLAQATGLEFTAIRERFKEYDSRLLQLHRQKVAYKASRTLPPLGISVGRVGDLTEVSLIKKEAVKKTRHIAVRALMKRAGKAIQALKPCFMMSPMSVAQYLEPGVFNFDLVVMDEASQIKPEDALGAIARGSRLVVVGDPKQLPPTSFFQKAVEEDGDTYDEDIVGVQDSESILESVIPMFKTRRLRWHYRSKHESLIAFSNKNFYDSDLVLFPSPFQASDEFGIKRHYATRGRFVNRRNVEEAQEVVKAAMEHLLTRSNESLGIVAMNIQQREEIEKQLEQQIKDNVELKQAFESNLNSEEPLFIKNLENVQGDERDVIFISMTYGPEQIGGKPMQRFGPINSDVGWRRLNVLFTRAKKRMHIFTSMMAADITPTPSSSRGVTSLKAFLEYIETGHLHQTTVTGKGPDSDFEMAVMEMLGEHGYECEAQLGVAGFFLDIAVRDPGNPGRYLLGIECDGATYHSAKSARDRDYLRQKILEDLGWEIRRIWSTDWFKNPHSQIQPILHDLELLRTPSPVLKNELEDDLVLLSGDQEKNKGALTEVPNNKDIRALLSTFDKTIIRRELPSTEENQRLLREEMLELLLELKPTSKAEFQERIPGYLRMGTAPAEARYLEDVLSLIADYAI